MTEPLQNQTVWLIFVAPLSNRARLGSSQQLSHHPLHCLLFPLPLSQATPSIPADNFLLAAPFSTKINSCKYTSETASPTKPDRSIFLFRFSKDPCPLMQNTPRHTTLYLQSLTSSFLLSPSLCTPTCSNLSHPELNKDLNRPTLPLATLLFLILHSPLLSFNLVLRFCYCSRHISII